MIIGITGGSGCGKTTLLALIREMGGLVLDCDEIYHQLLLEDEALLAVIEARFPGTVIGGSLDRKKLGRIVFADPGALADLNRITHSAVRRAVCQVTVAITAPETWQSCARSPALPGHRGHHRTGAGADPQAHRPGRHHRGICPQPYRRPAFRCLVPGALQPYPRQRRHR